MQNVTRLEREIAKALGVTPNMLDVLRRINRGDPISGNNSGTALEDRGYLTSQGWEYDEKHRPHWRGRELTDAGRELLTRARAMGF